MDFATISKKKVYNGKDFLHPRALKDSGAKEKLAARVFSCNENDFAFVKTAEKVQEDISRDNKGNLL